MSKQFIAYVYLSYYTRIVWTFTLILPESQGTPYSEFQIPGIPSKEFLDVLAIPGWRASIQYAHVIGQSFGQFGYLVECSLTKYLWFRISLNSLNILFFI